MESARGHYVWLLRAGRRCLLWVSLWLWLVWIERGSTTMHSRQLLSLLQVDLPRPCQKSSYQKSRTVKFYLSFIGCCLLVCGGCGGGAGEEATDTVTVQPIESERLLPPWGEDQAVGSGPSWGLYQILWQPAQFIRDLDQERTLLGGSPEYVLFFRDLHPGRGFPAQVVSAADARGLTPVISLELSIWGQEGDHYLQAIINGEYDNWFTQWGREAAEWGKLVYMRFGFEMNGDWFGWGRQPTQFKAAWRRAHALVAAAGADNVRWMFSPNVLYGDMTATDGIDVYYPGDDVVDAVACDGYNFGDQHSEWHRWQDYETIFAPTLQALAEYRKPLFIAEIGCADDPRKAAWLADGLTKIRADTRLHGVIFFHYDKRREQEHNWRLDSDPDSLQIFRAWADLTP